jgi:DNA-binding XRE family transcriptional regulator
MITKQQLRSARAFLGLNQSNIAENIGVTTKTISNIEEGDGIADNKYTGALQQFFEMETRKNLSHLSGGYDSLISWGSFHGSKQSIRIIRAS